MKILVVDNYDSFVYNLVQLLREDKPAAEIVVVKNDRLKVEDAAPFDKILLSPGPGLPAEAGQMPALIDAWAATKSILGICLGHQAIGQQFGCQLVQLAAPLHGIATGLQRCCDDYLFDQLPPQFTVGHYHSWVVGRPLPSTLELMAVDSYGHVMAVRHRKYDLRGLQFHPESVLTPQGATIIHNWLSN
jgi:anthranilate synthase component 2